MTTSPLQPVALTIDTPHYVVRTLDPSDAIEAWSDWLADPDTARNLNAKPQRLDLEAIRSYIASFNRTTSHIFGIFDRATGKLVGIRAIYVDTQRREFVDNLLIGDKEARGKNALHESRDAIYPYFFDQMNLQAARCVVAGDNSIIRQVLAKRRWIETRVETRQNATADGTVELHHFRLPRETWKTFQR